MIISNVDHRTCEHPDETVINFTSSGVCICSLCGHRTAHEFVYEEKEVVTGYIYKYIVKAVTDEFVALKFLKANLGIGSAEALLALKNVQNGILTYIDYDYPKLETGLEIVRKRDVEMETVTMPVYINTGMFGQGPVA